MYYGTTTQTYLKLSCGLVPFFWLLRYCANALLFQGVAHSTLAARKRASGIAGKDSKEAQLKQTKFAESLWKASAYGTLHLYTWVVLLQKAWLFRTSDWWRYDAANGTQQLEYEDMLQLYVVQTSFYLSSIGMLALWETRRKDFAVMMAHHFVTLGLLVGSFAYGYTRAGSVILLLHDFSDIWLEIAKLANYAGKETLSTISFVVMTLSWGFLRLFVFPYYIIWSVMWECQMVSGVPLKFWYLLNGLLCTLVVMHVYWFVLILKVAITVVKGSATDVREEE